MVKSEKKHAGNLGACEASEAARALEHACRDGAAKDRIGQQISELAVKVSASRAALQSWQSASHRIPA